MSMEEFADNVEMREEEGLTQEEILEENMEMERQFNEDNFMPAGYLPPDWYLF